MTETRKRLTQQLIDTIDDIYALLKREEEAAPDHDKASAYWVSTDAIARRAFSNLELSTEHMTTIRAQYREKVATRDRIVAELCAEKELNTD